MNTFSTRVDRIKLYWSETFGRGPAFDTCVVVSVLLLAFLYMVALAWMVPHSVIRTFAK